MTEQLMNLPINIPWKLIAVSPDMMDKRFCNKRFPFAWRSSLAISAYEPRVEELPDNLCEGRLTYLKITCTITGYQPSEEEIRVLHIFPDYTKNMPYECNPGEKLRFVVKGYTDVNEIREVPINGNKVVWKHTKGNGEFRRNRDLKTGIYSGTYIDFIITEITNPYDKEKLIFVSAHYLSLTDATWIKVVR